MTPNPALIDRFGDDFRQALGRPLSANDHIALAVSGGADSMAMLALAAGAFPGRIAAATVDHGLRASARGDGALVAGFCRVVGVDHAILTPGEPITGASIQAQARRARYAVLGGWARARHATMLVTAHQADDQAETLLMRAARGSGLSGLAGVRARRLLNDDGGAPVTLLRPLLDWRRAELRAIVRRAGIPFVDDPANEDDRHDRTRFRRLLGDNEWLDPPRLARSARYLAEADDDMRQIADWAWRLRALIKAPGRVALDVNGVPQGLRRRLALRAIGAVRDGAGITQPDWSDGTVIEPLLAALESGRSATQAGVLASADGDLWQFREAPPRRTR